MMQVQRLSWAGIKITAGSTSLLIDAFADPDSAVGFDGRPIDPSLIIPAGDDHSFAYAAITHRHSDHYHQPTLSRLLAEDGRILCWQPSSEAIVEQGYATIPLDHFESHQAGDLTVTPVPAVDGLGAQQVSWVVEADGRRIIHCGDTQWHGHWWKIAADYGPFDAAFLPINGAVVNFANVQPPSEFPMCLTPEQAAEAAMILGVKQAVPIHYQMLHLPGEYEEQPDAEARFLAACHQRSVSPTILAPGDELSWND